MNNSENLSENQAAHAAAAANQNNALGYYKIKIEFAGTEVAAASLGDIIFNLDEADLNKLSKVDSAEQFAASLQDMILDKFKIEVVEDVCSIAEEDKKRFVSAVEREIKYVRAIDEEARNESESLENGVR